jgi:predicted phage terminase large subunit-like protein
MAPCGKRWVRDLTVAGENHYITESGLVNRNCFDELTGGREGDDHGFSFFQFWYLLSRNRSTCGVRPYVRATCNPNADSWVADFIAWWIDQDTGFPILERAGKLRYVVRGPADKLIWSDDPEELRGYLPSTADLPPGVEPPGPKSVTFIPANIYQNPALLRINPEYLASLQMLPEVKRARLLLGNWKIRPAAGLYFRREWCEMIDVEDLPVDLLVCRYWDLAGTEKTETNDPDWSVGVKLGQDVDGHLYVVHVVRLRGGPYEVENALINTASIDSWKVPLGFGLDPGQAGKWQAAYLVSKLIGYNALPAPETGDKATRFGPFSSQCRAGNVRIVRGDWNEAFFRMLEGFPDLAHDDDVDACSGALELLLAHLQQPMMITDETIRRAKMMPRRRHA